MLEKKLYDKLVNRIKRLGEKDKDRYILDLKDSYLFYFPSSGKILNKVKNGALRVIFRKTNDPWILKPELKKLLRLTLKNDEA